MTKRAKKFDIADVEAREAVERYGDQWAKLPEKERELAQKVVMLTRHAGGRKAAADAMGVSVTTVDNYRSGQTQPRFLELIALAKAAEHPVEYLLLEPSADDGVESAKGNITLPSYAVQASAGGGALVLSQDINGTFTVGRDWLSRYVPPGAKAGVIEARGDSMEPTIFDGDILLLNFSINRTAVDAGGIFVITVDGSLLVKRLQVTLDGHVLVISDNDRYETERLSREFADERMIVHAQVVWSGGPVRNR